MAAGYSVIMTSVGLLHISSALYITVYPKKYAHGFCFAVLCCGYNLTDFPISIRLTSLALWQSNDCPSASKETLMNMDKYFMWIHYGQLHYHNKAKHNKTVCIFLGIYCIRNVDAISITLINCTGWHIAHDDIPWCRIYLIIKGLWKPQYDARIWLAITIMRSLLTWWVTV